MSNSIFSNYIDGEWRLGASTSVNINPSDTADLVGEYARATAEQAQEAIEAADRAFQTWQFSNIEKRAEALNFIGTELAARSEELGVLLSREEGKTRAEGIGEVQRAANVFKFFAGEALRLSGELLPSVRNGMTVEITREPLGVVGIITPWNFPIAIPSWKIAPALCYGNAVVFKCAELVPASAWALTEIISRSGLPRGVFNLVMGKGSVVGAAFVGARQVKAISFTGSTGTGRSIAADCVASHKKVQMEMGGKNPLVVLDDANLDVAVEVAVAGAYYSTGQRCTASSRFIVTDGIHDRFVAAVKHRLETLTVGHALDPETKIGPVVDASQFEQDLSYIELGKTEGAALAFGGRALERRHKGYYLEPALFVESTPQMRLNQEEIFGPVASVIRVRDFEEALHVANDVPFGLSSGICTQSLRHAADFKRKSQAGMVMVNAPTAGVDYHAPFGGRKESSYGPREQGRYASEFYTSVKTAYVAA